MSAFGIQRQPKKFLTSAVVPPIALQAANAARHFAFCFIVAKRSPPRFRLDRCIVSVKFRVGIFSAFFVV